MSSEFGQDFKKLAKNGRYQELLELCQDERSIEEKFWKSKSLLRLGRFEEAFTICENTLQLQLSELWKAKFIDQLGSLFWITGQLDDAEKKYMRALQIYSELKNTEGIANVENNLGLVNIVRGNLENAINHLEHSLNMKLQIGMLKSAGDTYNNIGGAYFQWERLDLALENYENGYEIRKKYANQKGIADSLNNIGTVYFSKGKLSAALDYFNQSYEIRKDLGNPQDISISLQNTGMIYQKLGKYSKAHDTYLKSLRYQKKVGNNYELAGILINISNIYEIFEDLDIAYSYAQHAFAVLLNYKNNVRFGNCIITLIKLTLQMQYLMVAKQYLEVLTETVDKQKMDDHPNNHLLIYGHALIKASQPNMSDKLKALEILEELFDENLTPEFQLILIPKIIELMLLEYKAIEGDEIYEKLHFYLNKLDIIARKEKLFPMIIKSNLLQAELEIIQQNYDKAIYFLEHTNEIINDQQLDIFQSLVDTIKESINEQYVKVMNLEIEDIDRPRTSKSRFISILKSDNFIDLKIILHPDRFKIMRVLDEITRISQSELQQLTNIASSSLSRHLSLLEENDYVISSYELANKRPQNIITISPSGALKLSKLLKN